MASAPKILAFSGSLRQSSYNGMLAEVAASGARDAGADVTVLRLRDLPLPVFSEDLEAAEGAPANAKRLKELFIEHQGLLISSPEYNSSITAALKNAIDWVSRPAPSEQPLACFRGKLAAVVAASPGALGGLRGLGHLRSILTSLGVLVLPDQRAIARAHEAFDEEGSLRDESSRAAVQAIGAQLARTIALLHTQPPAATT